MQTYSAIILPTFRFRYFELANQHMRRISEKTISRFSTRSKHVTRVIEMYPAKPEQSVKFVGKQSHDQYEFVINGKIVILYGPAKRAVELAYRIARCPNWEQIKYDSLWLQKEEGLESSMTSEEVLDEMNNIMLVLDDDRPDINDPTFNDYADYLASL